VRSDPKIFQHRQWPYVDTGNSNHQMRISGAVFTVPEFIYAWCGGMLKQAVHHGLRGDHVSFGENK
jgi:hypothetical protein